MPDTEVQRLLSRVRRSPMFTVNPGLSVDAPTLFASTRSDRPCPPGAAKPLQVPFDRPLKQDHTGAILTVSLRSFSMTRLIPHFTFPCCLTLGCEAVKPAILQSSASIERTGHFVIKPQFSEHISLLRDSQPCVSVIRRLASGDLSVGEHRDISMTRLLLIILLFLSSGPAYGGWMSLGESD